MEEVEKQCFKGMPLNNFPVCSKQTRWRSNILWSVLSRAVNVLLRLPEERTSRGRLTTTNHSRPAESGPAGLLDETPAVL